MNIQMNADADVNLDIMLKTNVDANSNVFVDGSSNINNGNINKVETDGFAGIKGSGAMTEDAGINIRAGVNNNYGAVNAGFTTQTNSDLKFGTDFRLGNNANINAGAGTNFNTGFNSAGNVAFGGNANMASGINTGLNTKVGLSTSGGLGGGNVGLGGNVNIASDINTKVGGVSGGLGGGNVGLGSNANVISSGIDTRLNTKGGVSASGGLGGVANAGLGGNSNIAATEGLGGVRSAGLGENANVASSIKTGVSASANLGGSADLGVNVGLGLNGSLNGLNGTAQGGIKTSNQTQGTGLNGQVKIEMKTNEANVSSTNPKQEAIVPTNTKIPNQDQNTGYELGERPKSVYFKEWEAIKTQFKDEFANLDSEITEIRKEVVEGQSDKSKVGESEALGNKIENADIRGWVSFII